MLLPQDTRAVTIAHFGGVELLKQTRRPVPDVGAGEVLIRISYAGVGAWDPNEREGEMVEDSGPQPKFPMTLGSDGSGEIVAVGTGVKRVQLGDLVYAAVNGNPRGGFCAEYAAVNADNVSLVPEGLELDQAAAMPVAGMTAERGLVDMLHVASGEALLIFGASGDLGHLAVQLAKCMGARVLAVASGEDGVTMVSSLGADAAVDGKTGNIAAAIEDFAPEGLDAVLAFNGGRGLATAIGALREGGRLAFPDGVELPTHIRSGIDPLNYSVVIDASEIEKLNRSIAAAPFTVNVARVFPMNQAIAAQKALKEHRVGKLVLEINPGGRSTDTARRIASR